MRVKKLKPRALQLFFSSTQELEKDADISQSGLPFYLLIEPIKLKKYKKKQEKVLGILHLSLTKLVKK